EVLGAEITRKGRVANEIADVLADVLRARQPEQARRGLVEPANLPLRVEHDRAVRHGIGGLAESAQQALDALLALLVASMAPVQELEDVAPGAVRFRRRIAPTVDEPVVHAREPVQVP